MNTLFKESIDQIEQSYKTLGHQLGWRFLTVSRQVLDNQPRVAFISLNPGGKEIPPDHPWESCEDGNAYVAEQWGDAPAGQSSLQRQVQMLFDGIGRRAGVTGRELMESSLMGHLVPFRSPRLADLKNKPESLEFGRQLWTRLLSSPTISPDLIVCMSRDIYDELSVNVLPSINANRLSSEPMPTGWGSYTADVDVYERDGKQFALLRLPHLSTFKLFGRPQSADQLDAILDDACACMDTAS